MMRRSGAVLVMILLGVPSAWADEPPPAAPDAMRPPPGQTPSPPPSSPPPSSPPTSPPSPPPSSAPLPVLAPTGEPAPAPAAAPPAAVPGALQQRRNTRAIGVGGGSWILTADPAATGMPGEPADLDTIVVPTIVIEGRLSRPFADSGALFTSTQIIMQDFAAMADYYRWFFAGTDDEVTQKLFLWPGLLFGWAAGSHIATTYGVTVYLQPRAPSLYLDLGTQCTVFIRPSGDDFELDLGLGLMSNLGYELSDHQAVQLSAGYSWPLFHGAFESDGRRSIVASLLWVYRR
jgi:hypothetical protein